ncbi:MAG: PQQ-dependent sugar dehydrogenase [Planctomyces sp.]|nr:PQQ-dependent sugar dehydrogenase [Planctomyces sp.]
MKPGNQFIRRSLRALSQVAAPTSLVISGLIISCFTNTVPGAMAAEDSTVDSSRFEVNVLATGLVQPMELAVAPDGKVFFIEIAGKLKMYDPATRQVALVGEMTITTEQENGLIGLALDPDFARTQWIFLQYSPPDYPVQHISRFTLRDGKLDMSSEKMLLKFEEQRKECCHHAGSLHFGPRGELFIATGDNTHPHGDSQGYAPIDERPDRAPWDAQKSSANTNSYSGKILRIHPLPDGTYEIPDGNLFPKDGSKGRPEIYAMGCRNPWRMTVDSETGFVYWGEVGPDAGGDGPRGPKGYDEINQARKAGNFGWPYFIANNQPYTDYDYVTGIAGPPFELSGPANESPNNTGEKILPPPTEALLYYPYGASDRFPELGTGGRSACAGPVYHFDESSPSSVKFPQGYDDALFIFEWTRHWIKVVHLDENHDVQSIEPFMPGQKFVRPVDMAFGPEGSLYLMEYGETWGVNPDARLVRIDYVRGNRAPVVTASVQNNLGRPPLKVAFSSEGTFDKDTGDSLSYEWRLIDATQPNATPEILSVEASPTVTIEKSGVFNAELVVTDSHGATRTSSVPVVIGNERPQLRFLKPEPGDFLVAGQPIQFELIAEDFEDGTNDFDAVDEKGAKPIDVESPARMSLNAVFLTGPVPGIGGSPGTDEGPAGMKRMKGSDCFNCHAADQKRVGPPLIEIANKYRGKDGALEASVQRVMKGSTGVWGKVPMIPHSHHTEDEVREMVSWIYSLEPAGLIRVFHGFNGEISVTPEEASKNGYYRLEASYTDRGADQIPPLSATAVAFLRPRVLEAESADEILGSQVLNSGNASGGKFIGAIDHGHILRFRNLSLEKIHKINLRIASAGAGGSIELRLDQPDGPVLATTEVVVNGNWEEFYDRTLEFEPPAGRHDLIIRFTHPGNAGGLMNLDSVEVIP